MGLAEAYGRYGGAWRSEMPVAFSNSPRGLIALAMIACLATLMLVKTLQWALRQKLSLKYIVLADEMSSSAKRALEYCYRPREVMLKGYQQFPDQVYGMDTRDGVKVVIPPRFLDELKSHPHLSFIESINNDMQAEYTMLKGPPEYVIHAIKGGITSVLPAYTPILHRIVQKSMPRILGQYRDWTKVKIHDRILHITGTNNARVFQGTSASHDDEWVELSTAYVVTTFDAIRVLKQWPPFLRSLVYRFAPQREAINKQWSTCRKRLAESIRERQQKDGNLEDPPSMLDFLSSGKNEHLSNDADKQLQYQMTMVAVGTVTTFSSAIQAIYDLAAYPDYIPVLREEVLSVPRNADGTFNKESIMALKKMDSFIKESQRLSAPDLSTHRFCIIPLCLIAWSSVQVTNVIKGTFQRASTANMTLPDGTFIPKGTKMEINTASIHVDPQHYESPHDFDGLRYYRMRQVEGEEMKHLYYSVGKNDLSFGYGRHACPGRYLGHLNIKLILSELLTNYDLKLPPGTSRPKNLDFEAISAPDAEFEILLKNRNL